MKCFECRGTGLVTTGTEVISCLSCNGLGQIPNEHPGTYAERQGWKDGDIIYYPPDGSCGVLDVLCTHLKMVPAEYEGIDSLRLWGYVRPYTRWQKIGKVITPAKKG